MQILDDAEYDTKAALTDVLSALNQLDLTEHDSFRSTDMVVCGSNGHGVDSFFTGFQQEDGGDALGGGERPESIIDGQDPVGFPTSTQQQAGQASPFHPNLVSRSGPTQQQQRMIQALMQQNGHRPSFQPPSSGVQQGNLGQSTSGFDGQDSSNCPNFLPLSREKFMSLIREWWQRQGIKLDPRIIMISNRQIDIYQLHTEVLQFGGVLNVKCHDLWNVIAENMGWSAAAISEVGRTQDQIAEQFKLVYEQLLESFEQTYEVATMKQQFIAPAQQATDHQGGPSQPCTGSVVAGLTNQMSTQQQAMLMIKLSTFSAEQMRTGGYPETLINNVELNRPALQATWRRVQMQRLVAQQHAQQQQKTQQHMGRAPNNAQVPAQNQHPTQSVFHNSPPMQSQGPVANANPLGHPGLSAGSSQQNDTSMQRLPITPQNMSAQNMQMLGMLSSLQKPTPEMVKQAVALLEQLRADISKERSFGPEHVKNLSDSEKAQFPRLFEGLLNILRELGRVLLMYLATTNDITVVKEILNMLDICDKQRQLLQSTARVYVLDIPMLEKLVKTAMDIRSNIGLVVQQLRILQQAEHNQSRAAMQQQLDGGLSPPSTAAL